MLALALPGAAAAQAPQAGLGSADGSAARYMPSLRFLERETKWETKRETTRGLRGVTLFSLFLSLSRGSRLSKARKKGAQGYVHTIMGSSSA